MTNDTESARADWDSVPSLADSGGTTSGTPHDPGGRRRDRRPTRRALVSIVSGAAALVLVVVGSVVAISTGSATYAPARTVDAFLTDLESGHVGRALAVAHVSVDQGDVLLSRAAYTRAAARVGSHRVLGSSTSGDSATVSVALRQSGHTVPATFDLERSGTAWGVFPTWRMSPLTLGTVAVSVTGPAGTPLTVAGQHVVTGKDGSVVLRALPGSYPVQLPDTTWFTGARTSSIVAGFGGNGSAKTVLQPTLTAAARAQASAAVDAWVDGCIASTDIEPAGCSFYAYGEDAGETYTNQRWTLDARPAVEIDEWTGSGWRVSTTSPGAATYTARFTGPTGSGTGTAGPISFFADGAITAFTADGATFVPAVTNESGGETGS